MNTLRSLFEYKAWANDGLLTTLAALDTRSRVIPLAIKALSHTHVVDRIFAAHLRRRRHTYLSANLDQMPTLAQMSADIRASDREYVGYVAELNSGELAEVVDFVFTDGAAGRMSRAQMLMHVITHGVGHRGQVSAVMLLNSLPPPWDGYTTYLHRAETPLPVR